MSFEFFENSNKLLSKEVDAVSVLDTLVQDICDLGYFFEKELNPSHVEKQLKVEQDDVSGIKIKFKASDGDVIIRIYATTMEPKPRIKIGVNNTVREFFDKDSLVEALNSFSENRARKATSKTKIQPCLDRIKRIRTKTL